MPVFCASHTPSLLLLLFVQSTENMINKKRWKLICVRTGNLGNRYNLQYLNIPPLISLVLYFTVITW